MTAAQVARLAEFVEEDVVVSTWSTIRVRRNTYSVPSRLIGETRQGARLRRSDRGLLRGRVSSLRASTRATASIASTTGTSSGLWFESPRLRAVRLPRGALSLARLPPRIRRDDRLTAIGKATSSTCAFCISRRARWRPTSRSRSRCSRRSTTDHGGRRQSTRRSAGKPEVPVARGALGRPRAYDGLLSRGRT